MIRYIKRQILAHRATRGIPDHALRLMAAANPASKTKVVTNFDVQPATRVVIDYPADAHTGQRADEHEPEQ